MEGSRKKRSQGDRFQQDPPLDWLIAARAREQHGVIALWQLLEIGLSGSAVRHRVTAGRLHRIHAGVFAVGHARLTRDGCYMAAVLACGGGAALSHRSAADKRGLRRTERTKIDVISRHQRGRGRAGIDAHTSMTLLPRDIEILDGIPCTTVSRTLLDLAAVLPRQRVERAFDQADVLRVLDALGLIEDVLRRTNGHPGNAALRAILHDRDRAPAFTRNRLEQAFLAICQQAGIPLPEVNAWIPLEPGGYEADFLWREQRLIAETDGRDVHTTRQAFERDRIRDQRLMLAGFRVVRFPWQQVMHEPATVKATIRALLRDAA